MADSRVDFGLPTSATQGRVKWRGAWSSGATYSINDAVSAAGSSYICIQGNNNIAVSNTLYWDTLCSAGGVSSVAGHVGVVTLVGADISDHDTALGTANLDASGFLKPAQYNETINAQVGTTYAIAAGDRGKVVTFSNAASIAASIAQATGSFAAGWFTTLENIGAGLVTITATTSTIEGSATVTLKQWESVTLVSAGGNYLALRSKARVAIADLASGTSAQLAAAISDETGTGALVFGTSPTIATPSISSPTITGTVTATAIKQASGAPFNIADPLGQSHVFISSSSPYTNTFINGNGAGVVFLGSAAKTSVDDVTGNILLSGATSGTTTIKAAAVAGSSTLTLPAATDTLVGKATTDTFSSKTLIGASLGNSVTKADFKPAASAIVGTGADATFFTYTLPANTLAVGAGLHYRVWYKHTTGTASVTYKVSFGGTNIGSFTSPSHGTGSYIDVEIYNNGSTSAQLCSVHYNDGDTAQLWAFNTTAINTTSGAALTFTFNVANTDQITPEMARGFINQ